MGAAKRRGTFEERRDEAVAAKERRLLLQTPVSTRELHPSEEDEAIVRYLGALAMGFGLGGQTLYAVPRGHARTRK